MVTLFFCCFDFLVFAYFPRHSGDTFTRRLNIRLQDIHLKRVVEYSCLARPISKWLHSLNAELDEVARLFLRVPPDSLVADALILLCPAATAPLDRAIREMPRKYGANDAFSTNLRHVRANERLLMAGAAGDFGCAIDAGQMASTAPVQPSI
jgi:hypothetical protein